MYLAEYTGGEKETRGENDLADIQVARQNVDDEGVADEVKTTETESDEGRGVASKSGKRKGECYGRGLGGPVLTQITDQLHFETDAILTSCI